MKTCSQLVFSFLISRVCNVIWESERTAAGTNTTRGSLHWNLINGYHGRCVFDGSVDFLGGGDVAANRFHETLIAKCISQSDNRKTEASLWRFWPYLLVQPKPLFLGRVVFNTVTMPCSLNTDND